MARSLLIDTNLLVLLVVGVVDKRLISAHKRTKTFTESDFDLLTGIVKRFHEIWVTSHCLAETSNLLKHTTQNNSRKLLAGLAMISEKSRESKIAKEAIFQSGSYLQLGVADAGMVQKAKRVTCSLTDDLDLYLAINRKGYRVYNFTHIRQPDLLA